MSEQTPRKQDLEELVHEDTECTLCVTYESYGRKYAEETYTVEITFSKWRHIRRNPDLYSQLEKDCSDRQARLTDVEATSVIRLTCEHNHCRSVVERQQWSRSLQKHFQDIGLGLATIEYSVPDKTLGVTCKIVSESPYVCSGDATAFKSKDKIVVITNKQQKEEVNLKIDRLLSERTVLPSASSGYISLNDSGYSNDVPLMTSITCNDLESAFFGGNGKARDYVSSKLEDEVCGGTFCIEDGKYKLLLFGENNKDLDTARATYESSVIQKTWPLKRSMDRKDEIIRECQEHFQKMKWNAWCQDGNNGAIPTVATDDDAKYVNDYMKMILKENVDKRKLQMHLAFSFQGKKLNLLTKSPKARSYVAQRVSKSNVEFEMDEKLLEFRLVTTEVHRDEAIQFLKLIRTIDIELGDINKQHLQTIAQKISKQYPVERYNFVVDTDFSTNVLSIAATDDAFHLALQWCERSLKEHLLKETYLSHKEVLTRALKHLEQAKCNDDITNRSNSYKTESKRTEHEMRTTLDDTEKNVQGKCKVGQGGKMEMSEEIQKILSLSEKARRFVVEKLHQDGLNIHITSSGKVTYMSSSELDRESSERYLYGCFVRKLIDFELLPIRAYLKPSQAQEDLTKIFEGLSDRVRIHADDARNMIVLVFTRDIDCKVDAEVERYLEEYTHSEMSFSLSRDEMKSFWLSSAKDDLERSFLRQKIKVELTGTTLVIAGAKQGVDACIERLQMKKLLPYPTISREVGRKDITRTFKRQLSTHMASYLDNNPNAKTFVEEVFDHVGLEAEVTPRSSDIDISRKTLQTGRGTKSIQKKRRGSITINKKVVTAESLKKTVNEEEPDLADKLLVYEDEVSGKLVVIGEKNAIDTYLSRVVQQDKR